MALTTIREIKFRPGTPDTEVDEKSRRARQFLEAGDKIKASVMFRGREAARPEIGKALLLRFAKSLEEVCIVESEPHMGDRVMDMVLAPK